VSEGGEPLPRQSPELAAIPPESIADLPDNDTAIEEEELVRLGFLISSH